MLFKLYGWLHTDDRPDDIIFVFHFIRSHVATGHYQKKSFTSKYREKYIYFVLMEHTLYYEHLTQIKAYIFWKLTVQTFNWYRA